MTGGERAMATAETAPREREVGEAPLPLVVRLHQWLVTVDHKRIGIMYIGMGLLFFVIAGLEASLMRWQLAVPDNTVVGPETFNRLFTMHGTTMVFFVGMPLVFGMANYLVPLMIGARDVAFPRLNAMSFWLSFFGGLLLYFSFIGGPGLYGSGSAPAVGWFAYAPLTQRPFSPGNSTDYWIVALLVSGFGSIAGAINLIATIVSMRCPGMTLGRMPLFVWLVLMAAVEVVYALPVLTAGQVMLLFDRYLGAHFFDSLAGGSAVLWQHFFWFFGHPEVYILVLPAYGIASEIIPVFSRKVIFGYPMMVAATLAIGFIGGSVWAHHMFSVGLGAPVNTLFTATTMAIAVPTGIKIFNWLGTMWGGRISFATPMLFSVAFIFQFLVAGLTGIMLAVVPFTWQVTDTYFVVAHFHYTLIGGLVFLMFAGIYYWFPKATGRMLDERLGRWHFWLFLIGFNMTMGILHVAGLLGMPRRIYTYQTGHGWDTINLIASLGVIPQILGVLVFAANVLVSLRRGAVAGDDPWDAWTLEWTTTSPPPEYNFETVPEVRSRRPLWDLKHPADPDWRHE
jgi:cytochrome c oxidase subunit 1